MADSAATNLSSSEREAFARYVHQDHARLKAFVWMIVKNEQDAEDIVQETLIRVVKRWNEPLENPAGFARTIARNLAMDHLRRIRPKQTEFQPGQHDRAETAPELSDQAQRLLQALTTLTPSQREALAWWSYGYKPAEIAEHTGGNPRTISSHISQGFKRLRQEMGVPLPPAEGKEVSDG